MLCRLAHVLLVVALVSAGGSAPFAHVHAHGHDPATPHADDAPAHNHAGHRPGQGAHWHLNTQQAADSSGATTLGNDPRHHAPVAVATVAVERPSDRGGATPALSEAWEAGIVPDLPGRPVPIDSNARPNPPPRLLLAARAPPR